MLELKGADAASADQKQAEEKAEEQVDDKDKEMWAAALTRASALLDKATGNDADLSSRLESRVGMLREEIKTKRGMLGLAA